MWQEDPDSPVVFCVSLYIDKRPKVYRFELPYEEINGQENTKWSPELGKFIVPSLETEHNEQKDLPESSIFEDTVRKYLAPGSS